MVFNKDFELIKEIKLEDYMFVPTFHGITHDGLFLNANHGLNNNFSGDFANFKIFNFDIIE